MRGIFFQKLLLNVIMIACKLYILTYTYINLVNKYNNLINHGWARLIKQRMSDISQTSHSWPNLPKIYITSSAQCKTATSPSYPLLLEALETGTTHQTDVLSLYTRNSESFMCRHSLWRHNHRRTTKYMKLVAKTCLLFRHNHSVTS